jgi:hypothetical protein
VQLNEEASKVGCIPLQVPKMLGALRSEWAPEAFLVSFKLETDISLLISKASPCLWQRTSLLPVVPEKQQISYAR